MPGQAAPSHFSRSQAISALTQWFAASQRILPWRSEPTLYRVWVSEIMLQQTQVVTVLPFFERFTARFPTVEALAAASEGEVVEAWAGLGYYSRARNLHRGARQIVAGGFPQTRDGWIDVPGVGPYTAGAITSIALGHPEPILDGNVERVLARVLALSRSSPRAGGAAEFKKRLWKWSTWLVRRAHRLEISPSQFNQAMMELGARVCTFRNPQCEACPIAKSCAARAVGTPEDFPGRKPPKEWIRVEELRHAWIGAKGGEPDSCPGERWLLRRQRSGEWRAGLWDLPLAAPPVGAAVCVGEVQTRHVVTRHRIERTTRIWLLRTDALSDVPAASGQEESELSWVDFEGRPVGASSALVKTWQAVRRMRESTPRSDGSDL